LQCVAVCCSVLQCVAVCCSALQRVAVCCSVLQCELFYIAHSAASKSKNSQIPVLYVSCILNLVARIFREILLAGPTTSERPPLRKILKSLLPRSEEAELQCVAACCRVGN